MVSTTIRLGSVAVDCADTIALADFYARLLGVEVAYSSEPFSAIKLDGVWLSMQHVDDYEPPTWPNPGTPQQIHLDFAVVDLDQAETAALAAGARTAEVQPNPERWRVLFDPAGHPFCLSSQIPD